MENVVTKPQECGSCGCVGYAFVPPQRLDSVFTPAEALQRGTLFPELELTIAEYGKVCKQGGMCNGGC